MDLIPLNEYMYVEHYETSKIPVILIQNKYVHKLSQLGKNIRLEKDFKYEGADIQTVNTILNPEIKQFNKGDYIIYTDQKKINLAVEVLEPEALNSFVYFSIIKTNPNQIIPIYRYYEKNKLF